MDYKVLDLEFSAGVNPFTVSKTLGVFPATIAEYYAGNTLNNDLIDLSEYGHTLTDYNTPATSISPLLDQDRNHLVYYALSDSQYFASVHSEWMNCFDANFAMTFVVKSPASAPLSEKMLFCHGETNVSGLYVSMDTSGYYKVVASKSGSNVTSTLSTNKADGYFHVLHIVRSGTSLTLSVDAIAGTTVDPSTFGIDVTETFYLGCYKGPANYWPGGWLYFRLQTTALSTNEISREVALWKGLAGGRGGCSHLIPTYTRPEASLAERVTGRDPITSVDPNWPAKASEGGMLVQGDVAQLCQRTREFDQTAVWSTYSAEPTQTEAVPSSSTAWKSWRCVASDADGSNLIAATEGGYLYISTDSGVTWTKNTAAGQRRWSCVASDADGSCLVAAVGSNLYELVAGRTYIGCIYTSSDGGASWTERTSYYSCWLSVATDDDGSVIIAGGYDYIYVSTNSGTSWAQKTAPGYGVWSGVCACSTDGAFLAGCRIDDYIWTSSNSGSTWTQQTNSGNRKWSCIDCDDDGSNLIAAVGGYLASYTGNIYTSSNSGVDWTPRESARCWMSVASDSDGSNLIACPQDGSIWTSSNSGTSWTERTSYAGMWNFVASDSDGSFLAAVGGNPSTPNPAPLVISSDSGSNWAIPTMPAGVNYIPFVSGVAIDSTGNKVFAAVGNDIGTIGTPGDIYWSTNGGSTWTQANGAVAGGASAWISIATKDGTTVVACTSKIYTSANGGATWVDRVGIGVKTYTCVDCDSDGSFMITSVYNGNIYTSDNSGASWTARTGCGTRNWYACSCDSTGTNLVAVANTANIWTSGDGGANWTERTNSGVRLWTCCASDSDGSNLIAGVNTGLVYTSTDYGATWTSRSPAGGNKIWKSVASNSNGQTLFACYGGPYNTVPGRIYRSTNGGVNWSDISGTLGTQHYQTVRCDPTGNYVIVGSHSGPLAYSTDGGTTWIEMSLVDGTVRHSIVWVSCDSDMSHLVAVSNYGPVLRSTNGGTTWTYCLGVPRTFYGNTTAASDADGSNFIVATGSGSMGDVYTSADSGATWTKRTGAGSRYWRAVCSDDDGSALAAAVSSPGYIYTSTDSGVTWTERTSCGSRSWVSIASSSDGVVLVAVPNGSSYIYWSSTGGSTWNERTGAGQKNWYCVDCSSNGAIIYAAAMSEYIWKSTNNGVNWSPCAGAGMRSWTSVWCSSDGAIVYATAQNGYIYKSTDSGTTWNAQLVPGSGFWNAFCADSTGTKYIANRFLPGASGMNASQWIGYLYTYVPFNYQITGASTAILAPDGTASVYKLVSSSDDQEHAVIQQITLTADYYIFEVDVTTGNKNWVYIKDQTVSNAYAYFNTTNGVVGTTGAGCTASVYTRNNRRRCAICVLGTAATHTFQISPAASDGVLAFAGDGSTPNVYVWEASCHLGKFQTLPVTRTTDAVTRSADNLTYPSDFIPGYVIGNSYINKKLTIEVRVKCQYKDTNDIGTNVVRPFLTIGGNTGTASQTRNHISIYGYNQYVYGSFYSNALTGTQHCMQHTVTDANQWHIYTMKLDFTNLSASTFYRDITNPYTGSSNMDIATYDFSAADCLLRIGQQYDGTVSGFCEIDYIKIWVGN